MNADISKLLELAILKESTSSKKKQFVAKLQAGKIVRRVYEESVIKSMDKRLK